MLGPMEGYGTFGICLRTVQNSPFARLIPTRKMKCLKVIFESNVVINEYPDPPALHTPPPVWAKTESKGKVDIFSSLFLTKDIFTYSNSVSRVEEKRD